MTKASARYTVLAALSLAAALYCLLGYWMIGDLAGAVVERGAYAAAELWLLGSAVGVISTVAFAVASWRSRRAR